MNIDSENIIPARRPSGRLSKPSMELLVDNQRILSQYIEPKKKRKSELKKFAEDINSPSNFSEKSSSLSSVEKYKPRQRRSKAPIIDTIDKDNSAIIINDGGGDDANNNNNGTDIGTQKSASPSAPAAKRQRKSIISGDVSNGERQRRTAAINPVVITNDNTTTNNNNNINDNNVDESDNNNNNTNASTNTASSSNGGKGAAIDGDKLLKRTAYVSIERNALVMATSPDKSGDVADNRSEDDMPLSKIYPDFKPRLNEPGEVRDTFTLPPKKKIKFVNINDLNGNLADTNANSGANTITKPMSSSSSSSSSLSSPMKVPKLKLIFSSPSKPSVMSMPKIPKKSSALSSTSSPSKVNGSNGEMSDRSVNPSSKSPRKSSNRQESSSNSSSSIINSSATTTAAASAASLLESSNKGAGGSGSPISVSSSISPDHQSTQISQQPSQPPIAHSPAHSDSTKRCIRPSCTNIAIEDFRWDKEFCSPDCAIMYSKHVFSEWLNQRKDPVSVSVSE